MLNKPQTPGSKNFEFMSTLLSFKIAKDIPGIIDNGQLKIPTRALIKERSKDIVSKDIVSKDIVSKDIVSKDIVSKDIVSKDIVSKYTMKYTQSKQKQSQPQIKANTKSPLKPGAKTLGKSGTLNTSGGGGMTALSKSLSGIIKSQKRTQWAMQSKKHKGAYFSREKGDDDMITEESHSDGAFGQESSNRIEIAKSNKLEMARSGRNFEKWGTDASERGMERAKEQLIDIGSPWKDPKKFGGNQEEK
jgi:hypothetical protein